MKVILFDLDGTLTDSSPGITACVQYALEKMGRPEPDLKKLEVFIGPPLVDQFMVYAGFSKEEADKATEYYRERYTKTGMFENALYPGIEELLAYLKDQGCVLAVASSKPEIYVRQILEHFQLTGYFTEIVGAELEEGGISKKEDVIEEALKRLHMESNRQDVVMVGDRSYDVLGAHACGIQCIGVAYGYGSMDELIKAGVTYVADSVEELEILAGSAKEEPKVEISSIDITELSQQQERQLEKELRREKKNRQKQQKMMPEDGKIVRESVPRKLWRVFYPILTHFGISNVISIAATMLLMAIGMLVLGIHDPEDLSNLIAHQTLAITGLGGLVAIPVLYLFLKQDEKRRISGRYAIRKVPEKNVSPQIILGTVLMSMGLCQVLNDLITLSGLEKVFPYYSQLETQVYEGQNLLLMLVVVAVIAPIAEELVFRGLVMMRIRDYIGPLAGILLSALCFGIYHGNAVQFIYAGLLGIFLGLSMERAQNIWVPILGHMAANFWSVLGMSVVAALAGNSQTTKIAADIVMAIVFLSGFGLLGFGKKKKTVVKKDSGVTSAEKADLKEKAVNQTDSAGEPFISEVSGSRLNKETEPGVASGEVTAEAVAEVLEKSVEELEEAAKNDEPETTADVAEQEDTK